MNREALVKDAMSLHPQLDRILAQVIVDLHLQCAQGRGEDYDPLEVAEKLTSSYKKAANENNSQHHPIDYKEDELLGQ